MILFDLLDVAFFRYQSIEYDIEFLKYLNFKMVVPDQFSISHCTMNSVIYRFFNRWFKENFQLTML